MAKTVIHLHSIKECAPCPVRSVQYSDLVSFMNLLELPPTDKMPIYELILVMRKPVFGVPDQV